MGIISVSDGFGIAQAIAGPAIKRWRRKKPIRVIAETTVGDGWEVVLRSNEAIEDFNSTLGIGREIHDFMMTRGAADYEITHVRLHMQNVSNDTVDIRDIRIVKTASSSPYSAAKIRHPSAGESTIPHLRYVLDHMDPRAHEITYDAVSKEHIADAHYFASKRISLVPQETFEFNISGIANEIYCEWHLELLCTIAGESGYIIVDNDGVPFRTSGNPVDGFDSDWLWVWWDPEKRGLHLSSEIHGED
jgi:hypothetical protein